jgi:hypothetical protein
VRSADLGDTSYTKGVSVGGSSQTVVVFFATDSPDLHEMFQFRDLLSLDKLESKAMYPVTRRNECNSRFASVALEVQSSLLLKIAASENKEKALSGPRTKTFAKDFKATAMQAIWANRHTGFLQT